ncbi:MAG: FAD-binding oxidoreductase [Alphaproteobacteria bacterium]|nr:FAD-binding oxidoreductase [Alphaproteobacteria bacterium]
MSPPVDPVDPSATAPDAADTVVIGGGIIGVATAYFLAKRGLSVALCEKGVIAGEQSSRNWGYCRQQGRDPRELPLIMESLRIWRGLDAEIAQALGGSNTATTGFTQAGVVYLAKTETDQARHEHWAGLAREADLDTRLLSPKDLDAFLPDSATDWKGALYTPSDGRAEPAKAAPALARAAQALGAVILTNCAVRGIETEAGAVRHVVTEKGAIRTKTVVVAGGAWSRLLLKRLGLDLPQQTVISSVFRTAPLHASARGPGYEASVAGPNFAWRKRADGGYTIAHGGASLYPITPDTIRLMRRFWPAYRMEKDSIRPRFGRRFFEAWRQARPRPLDRPSVFEERRIWDPEPNAAILDEARRSLIAAFPAFADMTVEQRWAGAIDVTPDAVPVISEIETIPGLIIATGFSGHGFGIGPGAGRLAADLAAGAPPIVDPTPFRFGRFDEPGFEGPYSAL